MVGNYDCRCKKAAFAAVFALVAFCAFADNPRTVSADATWTNSDIGSDDVITVNEGVTLTLTIDSEVTCKGLRGAGKVVKNGSAILNLAKPSDGDSLQDGVEVDVNAGTLKLKETSVGTCKIVIGESGSFENYGWPTFNGTVTVQSDYDKTILTNPGAYRSTIEGSGSLVKEGSGTVTVHSKCKITGNVTINAGVLAFGDSNEFPTAITGAGIMQMNAGSEGAVTISSGTTLRLVATDLQATLGYTASGVTLQDGASLVFVDKSGNTLSSEGTTLAPSGNVWTNKSGDSLWTTDSNWSTGSQPSSGDDIVLEISADTNLAVPSDFAAGAVTVRGTGVLTLSGSALTFGLLSVKSGATLVYPVSANRSLTAMITGEGRLIKTGSGILTLNNGSTGKVTDGGVTIEVAGGSLKMYCGNGDAVLGDVTFVLDEAADSLALDNWGWMTFSGLVTISNETDKAVFTNGGNNNAAIKGASGSFRKGGEGTLTFKAKFNQAATPIEVQDGKLLLLVADSQSYTYSGTVSGAGCFGKTGPGTLTHSNAQTYPGKIEVAEGEMALADGTKAMVGITGEGTLVNSAGTLNLLYGSDGYSLSNGTIKVTGGSVVLGRAWDCDGAKVRNGTFILDGGTVGGYGWPTFEEAVTFDVQQAATIFEGVNGYHSVIGGMIVKTGPALLTVNAHIGGNNVNTAIEIQEGRMTIASGRKIRSFTSNSVTGAGELYFSSTMTVEGDGLTVSNLTITTGYAPSGNEFTITGTLKPLAQLESLEDTFVFADGATVDVSQLTKDTPFGGADVYFSAPEGATLTIDVGDRTDCFDGSTYLCSLGAAPTMNLALKGTAEQASKCHLRATSDGIMVVKRRFVMLIR